MRLIVCAICNPTPITRSVYGVYILSLPDTRSIIKTLYSADAVEFTDEILARLDRV